MPMTPETTASNMSPSPRASTPRCRKTALKVQSGWVGSLLRLRRLRKLRIAGLRIQASWSELGGDWIKGHEAALPNDRGLRARAAKEVRLEIRDGRDRGRSNGELRDAA
jgi:hypothetical protein